MKRGITLLLALLCVGCGPVAIALGLREATKNDPPPLQDLGEPQVTLESVTSGPSSTTLPAYRREPTLDVRVRLSKPDVQLKAVLIGRAPIVDSGSVLDHGADFIRDGSETWADGDPVVRLTPVQGPNGTLVSIDLAALQGQPKEGEYGLFVYAVDAQGRSDGAGHRWTFDATPPTIPEVASVRPIGTRSLEIRWATSFDPQPTSETSFETFAASEISGYYILYDVEDWPDGDGVARIPPDPRPADPPLVGFAPLGGELDQSPVFVPGAASNAHTLSGLQAGTVHYVRVIAVDLAGNRTDVSTATEFAVRTRMGGDGRFDGLVTLLEGTPTGSLLIADLDNGFGSPELVCTKTATDSLTVFGNRQVSSADAETLTIPNGVRAIRLLDWNRDGMTDLLALGPGGFSLLTVGPPLVDMMPSIALEDCSGCATAGDAVNEAFATMGREVVVAAATVTPARATQPQRFEQIFTGAGKPAPAFSLQPLSGVPTIGERSHVVELVDFDRTGRGDLVVVDDDAIAILKRDLNGDFLAPMYLTAGGAPRALTIGDFRADGIPDIAVTTAEGDVAVILANGSQRRGDGTFAPHVRYRVGSNASVLTSADFNADGILDLAVAGAIPFHVTILLGNGADGRGDGTFRILDSFRISQGQPTCIVADTPPRGIHGLLISGENGIDELYGGGASGVWNGSFQDPVQVSPDGEYVVATDLDGDTVSDLVYLRSGNRVTTQLARSVDGQGDGRFLPRVNALYQGSIEEIALGDLNGDGLLDVVAAANADVDKFVRTATFLAQGADGFGNGAFQFAEVVFDPLRQSGVDPSCPAPHLGPERIPFSFRGHAGWLVTVDSSDPSGGDVLQRTLSIPDLGLKLAGACSFDGVVVADSDFDGKEDLLLFHGGAGTFSVARGAEGTEFELDATGSFIPAAADGDRTWDCGPAPWRPVAGRFNRDGVLDLAVINRGLKQVTVLLGERHDAAAEPLATHYPHKIVIPLDEEPTNLALVRDPLDRGRGMTRLVVVYGASRRLQVINFDVSSGGPQNLDFGPIPGSGSLSNVAAGDFNSDNIPDLAVAGGGIWVLFGSGDVEGD